MLYDVIFYYIYYMLYYIMLYHLIQGIINILNIIPRGFYIQINYKFKLL